MASTPLTAGICAFRWLSESPESWGLVVVPICSTFNATLKGRSKQHLCSKVKVVDEDRVLLEDIFTIS